MQWNMENIVMIVIKQLVMNHILAIYNPWRFDMLLNKQSLIFLFLFYFNPAQLAGAVEYTDCISAKGWDPNPNKYPRYDAK